jgi:hypothetical protein
MYSRSTFRNVKVSLRRIQQRAMKTQGGKEETAAWKQKSVWMSGKEKIVSAIDRRISDLQCSAYKTQKIITFISPSLLERSAFRKFCRASIHVSFLNYNHFPFHYQARS